MSPYQRSAWPGTRQIANFQHTKSRNGLGNLMLSIRTPFHLYTRSWKSAVEVHRAAQLKNPRLLSNRLFSSMAFQKNSRLLELADQVTKITNDIKAHLDEANLQEPDFSTNSIEVPSDPKYNALRDTLNDAASDLQLLVNGPRMHARRFLCTHNDLAAYQVAFEYDFFHAVPQEGSIAVNALAEKVNLNPDVYMLCTQRVFQELKKGEFAHTHGSIAFVRDAGFRAAAEYQLDEFFRAAGFTASSLKKSAPSPFQHAHGMSLFEYYGQNPALGARFALAMAGIAKREYPMNTTNVSCLTNVVDRQTSALEAGYAWGELKDKTVVDIGGGSGHVSIGLAQVCSTKSTKLIVVFDG
jgi:hypothetical protein